MDGHRKRRKPWHLLPLAGAAGAAMVYYWWCQQDNKARSSPVETSTSGMDGNAWASQDAISHEDDEEDELSMDNSMSSHFTYIQNMSTPQELEQLLPRLQAMLYEMTDVQAALSSLPADSPVDVKLRVMAQHSLARPLAAAWLIPLVDLLVRAKLNIIGRHMFLEEKLGRLRQPQAQMSNGIQALAQAMGLWGSASMGRLNQPLPPRLHSGAITAFLDCTYLATVGCPWMVAQVLQVVNGALATLDLHAPRTPTELCQLLRALHSEVEDALSQSLTGWTQLLLGETATPGPHHALDGRQMTTGDGRLGPPGTAMPEPWTRIPDARVAQMASELHQELRVALSGQPFADAVDAAVQHTLRALLANVQQGFPYVPPLATQPRDAGSSDGGGGHGSQGASPRGRSGVGAESPVGAVGRSEGGAAVPGRGQTWGRGLLSAGGAVGAMWSTVSWVLGRGGPAAASAPDLRGGGVSGDEGDEKPPRPLLRLLRPTQAATDPLFANVRQLSQATAALGPVLAFGASIFAHPVNVRLEHLPAPYYWPQTMSMSQPQISKSQANSYSQLDFC